MKNGKDVLETKMVQVFGLARGRNGYSFADVHDDNVLDRIKELYPIVYGKYTIPKSKLLGKEFAKGIMANVMKGISVNRASFGHETYNTNQWGKWKSKLDIFIAKKTSLLGTNVVEVKIVSHTDTTMCGSLSF